MLTPACWDRSVWSAGAQLHLF